MTVTWIFYYVVKTSLNFCLDGLNFYFRLLKCSVHFIVPCTDPFQVSFTACDSDFCLYEGGQFVEYVVLQLAAGRACPQLHSAARETRAIKAFIRTVNSEEDNA